VSFKDNHRATIIGERTAGSSGQPYEHRFENGMVFGLSTKREFLPDGSPFEGVGIAPDIEVPIHVEDLASGRDPALEKTLSLAQPAAAR
jgi:carboxyl-terminal processing protease